jgi:UDP-N-acetylglucosamine 2-epimerase
VGGGRIIGEVCHFIDLMRFLAESSVSNVHAATYESPESLRTGDTRSSEASRSNSSRIEGFTIVFPVHPRTEKVLQGGSLEFPNLYLIEPLGYLEFNYLVHHSAAVITDSGGIKEETTMTRIPCMTLRDSTELPETVSVGTNELVGSNPNSLGPVFDCLFAGQWKEGGFSEKWDGNTAERIVAVIKRVLKT